MSSIRKVKEIIELKNELGIESKAQKAKKSTIIAKALQVSHLSKRRRNRLSCEIATLITRYRLIVWEDAQIAC